MSQALPADLSSPSRELEKALLLPLTLVAIPVAPLLLHSPAWQLGAALARASRQAALTAGTRNPLPSGPMRPAKFWVPFRALYPERSAAFRQVLIGLTGSRART